MLAERHGLRVLAVNPPGWGSPALPDGEYRPTALARRLVSLFDELGLERTAYVGWSWGGTIGCHLAAAAPHRLSSLVLLDAGYTDFQDLPGLEAGDLESMRADAREQARAVQSWTWEQWLSFGRSRAKSWRPALEERLRASLREEDRMLVPLVGPDVIAAALYGFALEPPSATLPSLGDLDLPILLVAVSETVNEPWGACALDRFRAAVPHADVHVLDSGHDLFADALEDTVSLVGAHSATA